MDFKLAFSRLTGRHVLGPGVFWSTLGFGLLAHGLGSADIALDTIPGRIASVVIAHLAMMTVAYMVRLATFKLKPGLVALIAVVAGYALAGAVRGLALQISLYNFDVDAQGFSIYRLVGGVVVMANANGAISDQYGDFLAVDLTGVLALNIKVSNLAKVENLFIERSPIGHASFVNIVGEVIDHLEAMTSGMTIHPFNEFKVDVVNTPAVFVTIDQIQGRTADAFDGRQS